MYRYRFAIIGFGPAGINITNKLLRYGIDPNTIILIDPEFKGGDFSTIYAPVPGNTKAESYLEFFNSIKSTLAKHVCNNKEKQNIFLEYQKALETFNKLDLEKSCQLEEPAKLLRIASDFFKNLIPHYQTKANELKKNLKDWIIRLEKKNEIISASTVIISSGANPKKLKLESNLIKPEIPLCIASKEIREKIFFQENKKIAVIGSSHSAALAAMQLLKSSHHVIWFRRNCSEGLKYAQFFSDFTLHDNTGLKGEVAAYMKNLEKNPHANLRVIESNPENIKKHLPHCNHVVNAIGFEGRQLNVFLENGIKINSHEIPYDSKTGFSEESKNLFFHGITRPTQVEELTKIVSASEKPSSEKLLAGEVGIGKFYKVLNDSILETLINNSQF